MNYSEVSFIREQKQVGAQGLDAQRGWGLGQTAIRYLPDKFCSKLPQNISPEVSATARLNRTRALGHG
jgi:hypothetical protein